MRRKGQVINYSLKIFVLVILVNLFLGHSSSAQWAEYWTALPPYNTLWPLWVPVLSPVDENTGLPTPIVTSITPATRLAVQPALTWDPYVSNFPWLLYCTPLGLAYYDPLWNQISLWPPSHLLNAEGLPAPLALPPSYQLLPPTASSFFLATVPSANALAASFLLANGVLPPTAYLTASAFII